MVRDSWSKSHVKDHLIERLALTVALIAKWINLIGRTFRVSVATVSPWIGIKIGKILKPVTSNLVISGAVNLVSGCAL